MTQSDEPSQSRRRSSTARYPVAESALPAGSTFAASVSESIEHERIGLMQIQAMLRCLYEVLLYADDDDSVMHADVAQVAARLLSESVARLEVLRTRASALVEQQEEPRLPSPPPYQVRDRTPAYVC